MALLDIGWGIRQGARQIKASPGSVCRWRDTLVHQDEAGLTAKKHPSSKPKLTAAQCSHLFDLLSQGARTHSFWNEFWTLRRIATVIARHFGITYGPSEV